MRVLPVGLMVAVAMLGAAGCSNGPKDMALIAAPTSPVADVPIPAGFSMIKSDSTSKVVPASGLRFVDHHYSGSDDFMPVARFYKDKMPGNGWVLTEQGQMPHGAVALHFTKNNEECTVTVQDGSVVSHTHIRIEINPVTRGK